jgi:hypothetical protein
MLIETRTAAKERRTRISRSVIPLRGAIMLLFRVSGEGRISDPSQHCDRIVRPSRKDPLLTVLAVVGGRISTGGR